MKKAMCFFLCGVIGGSASGALSPEGVEQEMAAVTTVSMYSNVWGLVCPESPVILRETGAGSVGEQAVTVMPAGATLEDGVLHFSLRDGKAVVGFWNCENKLPESRRPNFGTRFDVHVEFEQSAPGETVWTVVPWSDGRRGRFGSMVSRFTSMAESRKESVEETLQTRIYRYCRRKAEGAGEHAVTFESPAQFYRRTRETAPYDGFDIEIRGPAGAQITVRRVAVTRKTRKGGFRKAFTLPEGDLWRAVGNINQKTLLYVNGREVPSSSLLQIRPHPHYCYGQQLQEVDLEPYLRPGRNVIAAYPAFERDANALLTATVVMRSGEVIRVGTDPTWRYVPELVEGWEEPGFKGATLGISEQAEYSASYMPAKLTAIRYGYRLYMQQTHRLPAYDGRIRFKAPDDNQLYFSADEPFRASVLCPAGLASQEPVIEWLLCRYRIGGKLEQVLTGSADTFSVEEDSIRFALDGQGERVPVGVYVLKAVLRNGAGDTLEDRIPEPLIVVGRLPMQATPGRSFEDGMDLEREAVIDFTNPDDPAFPWMEIDGNQVCEEPIVVTRNGLTYRETREGGSGYSSQILITYNYAFKHPGDFYLMKLEYPDDRPRFFGVNCSSEHDGRGDHSKAGPSVWTGIWHLNTGTMQELTWLFRPDPGYTSINLINMLPTSAAAASKLTIWHVKGRLPELGPLNSERRFGILTESARSYSGFGKTFRSSGAPRTGTQSIYSLEGDWRQGAETHSHLMTRLDAFTEWLDTCCHYTEYQRWAGQNVIFLAFFQYDGYSANAEPLSATGDSRLAPHITDIAARVFAANGVDFFSSIEYCTDPYLHGRYSGDLDLTDTPYLVNGEGKESRIWKTGYNFNHPEVRASMIAVAGEAVRKFRELPNFRGVNFTTSFSGCMMAPNYWIADDGHKPYDPLWYDYSDATIRRFEADTGTTLPIPWDTPGRFAMRFNLLTSDAMREQWVEWRAENMLDFFIEVRDALRKVKPDVKVTTGIITPGHLFDYAVEAGVPPAQSMREFGWDFPKFHGHEGIYTIPWLQGSGRYGFMQRYTSRNDRYETYLRRLRANKSPAHLRIGDGEIERMAMVDYCWLELERGAQALLPKREHWQVPYQYTMEGAAQGYYALKPYMQAMAAIDADTMLYGFTDTNLKIGNEQPLREFARFMRSLPKTKFKPVESPDRDLTVRTLTQADRTLFYALNPAPWPVEATLELDSPGTVKHLLTGANAQAPVRVTIPPYLGVAFEAGPGAVVTGWQTEGAGDMFPRYVQHMESQMTRTAGWLEDRRINSALLPEQKTTMRELMASMRQALEDRRYAMVWQQQNSWDFVWCSYFLQRQHDAIGLVTETDPPPPDRNRKTLRVVKTEEPPVIDGVLDEDVWNAAAVAEPFVDKDGKSAAIGTEVRALWDATHLYLAFTCRDNYPAQLKTDAEAEIEVMKDDSVVFLLQPDRKTSRHYQMAVTAAGETFDQQDYDYAFAPDWDAVARVTDSGWNVEIAFPFRALEVKPQSGMTWGGNFCRLVRLNLLPWSTWSYMPNNWHDPAGYGVLSFE